MRASQILVVDDEADIRGMVQEILTEEGYEVRVAGNAAEARAARAQHDPDLMLLDIWMPDMDGISLLKEWTREAPLSFPVVMMSGHGTVETAVEATKLGALDFVEKPLSLAKLLRTVEHAIEVGRQARAQRVGGARNRRWSPWAKAGSCRPCAISAGGWHRMNRAVMLVGEPGSGRETLARHLHAISARAAGPFVTVVLTGSNAQETENNSLGRERDGQITPGWLEEASAGTLFMNDLTDMLPDAQKLLLKVLEQGHYTRIGGHTSQPLDVRWLCSARPEIETRIADGRFRGDLYERLAAVVIRVPPLREYREDVPELLRYYTDALADSDDLKYRRFSVAAQNRLRNYPWPGNLQELRTWCNVV